MKISAIINLKKLKQRSEKARKIAGFEHVADDSVFDLFEKSVIIAVDKK